MASRAHSLPAGRYEDVLTAHKEHTAWIGNIPDSCAKEKELRELFRGHGITVLRAVISDCPDEHAGEEDGGDADSDAEGDAEEQGTDWWALALFGSKEEATKARNTPIQAVTGYGGEDVTLHVEKARIEEHLRASLDSDAAWAAGSHEHDKVGCLATRKGSLLAAAWREMCTVRIEALSQDQADEQKLRGTFGVFGELLEVISHEPTDRHRVNAAQCYWAVLRYHHPESAGRTMTRDTNVGAICAAGLWHTDRWRKLNNHTEEKMAWGMLAYAEHERQLSLHAQKQARSRSRVRMLRARRYAKLVALGAVDEIHARENEEDDAVAYNDDRLGGVLASQHSDPDREMYQPNADDDVFAVLRRRRPTAEERDMQAAVGGARGQPMYLCKLTISGNYEWVSYHILSHTVVGMALVQEFEDRLHAVEQQEVEAEGEAEGAPETTPEVAAARQADAEVLQRTAEHQRRHAAEQEAALNAQLRTVGNGMLSYQANPSKQVRSPTRSQDRVCDVTDNMWEQLLDDHHETRRLDQEYMDEVFEAEVKPWMRDLNRKKDRQIGTRLVDRKWQQASNSGNRRYIAGMKRKQQKREALMANRIQAKRVFVADLCKTQRTWILQMGKSMGKRDLPSISNLDPHNLKKVLLEITAAMNGVATDSIGGRRMHLLAAAREANINVHTPHWKIILLFSRLPSHTEVADHIGSEEKIFASPMGLLTTCPLFITFTDGREPVTIASLSDELNTAAIPGKFPPPRPGRFSTPETPIGTLSSREPAVSFSKSESELSRPGSLPAVGRPSSMSPVAAADGKPRRQRLGGRKCTRRNGLTPHNLIERSRLLLLRRASASASASACACARARARAIGGPRCCLLSLSASAVACSMLLACRSLLVLRPECSATPCVLGGSGLFRVHFGTTSLTYCAPTCDLCPLCG